VLNPWKAFSLQPPAAEITFEWPGGSQVLQLGRRSVAGRAYLRVGGDQTIYIVGTKLHERALDMDPHEWRDRNIFRNVGVESSRIEWQNGPAKLELARERKLWKMLRARANARRSSRPRCIHADAQRCEIGIIRA
jgi:hypothetical protein